MLSRKENIFNNAKETYEIWAGVMQQLIDRGIINRETNPEIFESIEAKRSEIPTREIIVDSKSTDTEAQEKRNRLKQKWQNAAKDILSNIPADQNERTQFIQRHFEFYETYANALVEVEKELVQEYEKANSESEWSVPEALRATKDEFIQGLNDKFKSMAYDDEFSIESGSKAADFYISMFKYLYGENYVVKGEFQNKDDAEAIAKKENIEVVSIPDKLYKAIAGIRGSDGQEIASIDSLVEKAAKDFIPVDMNSLSSDEQERVSILLDSYNILDQGNIALELYEFPPKYDGVRVRGYPDYQEDGVVHMARFLLSDLTTATNVFFKVAAESLAIKNAKNKKSRGKEAKSESESPTSTTSSGITINEVEGSLQRGGYIPKIIPGIEKPSGVEIKSPLEQTDAPATEENTAGGYDTGEIEGK